MTSISQTALPITDAALDPHHNHNYTHYSFPTASINNENVSSHNTIGSIDNMLVIGILIWVICIFGAMGNGMVIWLLGFRIKRNPFSTFILNLAVADLGVLLSVTSLAADFWGGSFHVIVNQVSYFLFLSMYSTSQSLLTAISVDRCVAVFFPLWHRCRRPPHFTTIVCALIWVLSVLLTAISCIVEFLNLYDSMIEVNYQFILNAVLCLPVMTIATVALFIKVFLKARQHQRGKLLTIVLLTLLFFVLFAFPLNVAFILFIFDHFPLYFTDVASILACLNSTVNPAIYILVGRKGKSRQKENMKMILEKVFREEEGSTEETPVGTQA